MLGQDCEQRTERAGAAAGAGLLRLPKLIEVRRISFSHRALRYSSVLLKPRFPSFHAARLTNAHKAQLIMRHTALQPPIPIRAQG